MPLTTEEILTHEEAIQQEIAEKQASLEAYRRLRAHVEKRGAALPSAAIVAEPTPSVAPVAAIPPRYIHPELAVLPKNHTNGDVVAWAMRQMTEDYTVGDLAALLKREGYALPGDKISVVLSRLKGRGQIVEVRRGRGRGGSLYRQSTSALSQEAAVADQPAETVSTNYAHVPA